MVYDGDWTITTPRRVKTLKKTIKSCRKPNFTQVSLSSSPPNPTKTNVKTHSQCCLVFQESQKMAQSYPLCFSSSSSSSSSFHDCKRITPRTTSPSSSSSSCNLKLLYFPTSHNLFPLTQSKTHFSLQPLNSQLDAKLDNPDAKSPPSSKSRIWVNPRSPRAKQLLKKSYAATSSPLEKLAKSLDSCNPTEQQVSEMLVKGLGENVTEREAMIVLDNMVNPETALLAFEYFKQKIKPARHVVLYNVTLKLFREIKDFGRAEKLFDEMLQRGVKPNLITFSTLVACASTCSVPHKAVEWFEKMPSFECEPDDNLSASMIYVYARIGNVDMALSLYDRAKTEKWRVDTVAFSALIKMYGMSGNYDACLSVYSDMKVLGAKPNMVTYNNLLYAMGRAKRARDAKTIYEEMVKNGFSPNWPTYAALLQAYCRARCSEDALSVYKEMKEKGKDVDKVLYNMLFDMCAHFGNADEAMKIFADMKSSGDCQPDNFTYTSLINMYSCMGKVTEAEALLNEMIRCGFEPNILALTSLVHLYGKAKRADDVVKIFNQLLDLGISPDDRFCDCLLYVATQIPRQEELGKITACIEKAKPKLGSVVRYLTEEHEGDGDFRKEALELFNSIDDDVKKSLCNCLIDLCVSLDVPDKARDLLDLALKLEIYTDIQFRSQTRWCLHLKKLSLGAAMTALRVWINDLSKALESGEELPPVLGINTGIGKHNVSDKGLGSVLESYLKELNAPFHKATDKAGWFLTTYEAAKSWLQSRGSPKIVAALDSRVLEVPTVALPQ
ncbi:pentatricopeptide repeat-containing protein At4g16390, chloroplastic-like [Lotus japonicus]|uniref:pentatricopeptide repeat-containing protein At4g16390, chloroplastic-like n=1 Tax=Lotus japonicus TaxID=34305 RepID=UPI002585660D|nr:pentatricopeptide repeat-containing protein At4g16390, chloroplastic-like [Lotus japonicus]